RHAILLAQIVAEIAGTVFVLDDHLVSALATGHHSLQECGPRTWHSSRLVAVVGGVVVGEHALDLLKRRPGNVRRVHIRDANLPLLLWEPDLFGTRRSWISVDGARAAIDKSARVGRVFEDLQDRCHGGSLPDQITEAIASRQ